MRTFTFRQAQELLPALEGLLRSAMEAKAEIEAIDGEFQQVANRIMLSGGLLLDIVPLARRRAHRDKVVQRIKDAISEIDSIGVQVKDLDIGLLDFPCVVDGEVILLCWKYGEEAITHWHNTEEGFAGRKPIDQRIINAKPPGDGGVQ